MYLYAATEDRDNKERQLRYANGRRDLMTFWPGANGNCSKGYRKATRRQVEYAHDLHLSTSVFWGHEYGVCFLEELVSASQRRWDKSDVPLSFVRICVCLHMICNVRGCLIAGRITCHAGVGRILVYTDIVKPHRCW